MCWLAPCCLREALEDTPGFVEWTFPLTALDNPHFQGVPLLKGTNILGSSMLGWGKNNIIKLNVYIFGAWSEIWTTWKNFYCLKIKLCCLQKMQVFIHRVTLLQPLDSLAVEGSLQCAILPTGPLNYQNIFNICWKLTFSCTFEMRLFSSPPWNLKSRKQSKITTFVQFTDNYLCNVSLWIPETTKSGFNIKF